jgi:hypothetical protein
MEIRDDLAKTLIIDSSLCLIKTPYQKKFIMNKLIAGIICLVCLNSYPQTSLPDITSSEFDVAGFYRGTTPTTGTKVLTQSDQLDDAQLILVPLKIDEGDYAISVTRKGSNLYLIDNKNIYIETKYCYEYSMMQKAVLKVESNFGMTKGKLVFKHGL